jgi:hypothetical protein
MTTGISFHNQDPTSPDDGVEQQVQGTQGGLYVHNIALKTNDYGANVGYKKFIPIRTKGKSIVRFQIVNAGTVDISGWTLAYRIDDVAPTINLPLPAGQLPYPFLDLTRSDGVDDWTALPAGAYWQVAIDCAGMTGIDNSVGLIGSTALTDVFLYANAV